MEEELKPSPLPCRLAGFFQRGQSGRGTKRDLAVDTPGSHHLQPVTKVPSSAVSVSMAGTLGVIW